MIKSITGKDNSLATRIARNAKYLYIKTKRNPKKVLNTLYLIERQNFIDTTAIQTVSIPTFAFLEKMFYHMDTSVSLKTRLGVAIHSYIWMGPAYATIIKKSREHYGLTQGSKYSEKALLLHDAKVIASLNTIVTPFFYLKAGETDPWKIIAGTAVAAFVGLVGGGPTGYAMDAYEDMSGLKSSDRIPDILRRQSRSVKIVTAITLTALSLMATKTIYDLTPATYKTNPSEQSNIIVHDSLQQKHSQEFARIDSIDQLVNYESLK